MLAILNCNGFYAQSYPTTIVYPTLESRTIKKLFKLFVSFLKMELIGCEIIAIDGTKAERTTVRKRTSIKRKLERHLY
jgi:hypothetical protein